MTNKQNNNRGFTLMVAMLVSTIVIVVGLGINSIVLRQFNLAVLSRESQSAFYAVDTLVECIMYWDLKGRVFAPLDPNDPDPNGQANINNLTNLVCDHTGLPSNEDVLITISPAGGSVAIPDCPSRTYRKYTTSLLLKSSRGAIHPIANAEITKKRSCLDDYTVDTIIDANGYNSDRPGDSKRIERGLQLTY